jgi:hypothetical protein
MEKYELVGFAAYERKGPAFVIPIFSHNEKYWIQKINSESQIKSFIEVGMPNEEFIPASMDESVGKDEAALYGFLTEGEEVVIKRYDAMKEYLRKIIQDIDRVPFVKLEVLCFIGDLNGVMIQISNIWNEWFKINQEYATKWAERHLYSLHGQTEYIETARSLFDKTNSSFRTMIEEIPEEKKHIGLVLAN